MAETLPDVVSSPDTKFFARALWPCRKIGRRACAKTLVSGDETMPDAGD